MAIEDKIAEIIAKGAWVKTPDQMAKEVAALIAEEQAPLVEALKEARDTLYQMYRHQLLAEEYSYDMDFFEECGKRAEDAPILAKIDKALEGR